MENIMDVTADNTTLMRQAPATIGEEYLPEAIHYLENKFGQGYALKNPGMLAAFLNCCCLDYQTSLIAKSIQMHADAMETLAITAGRLIEKLEGNTEE
jgi:hypothetical protein